MQWQYVQQPDWSDAPDIVEACIDHEVIDFTQEFLDQAPESLMLRDGPFIVLRGKTKDVCYEIIHEDFLRLVTTARQIKTIIRPPT